MNRALKKAIVIAITYFASLGLAQTAPTEVLKAKATHTSISSEAHATLSKNLFKTEEYQAEYTVQVPYQATETYTVEVPYQVNESYDVQVPYQTTETYTENVAYDVQVPYTDYETDYRQEYRCSPVTRYREECETRQDCYIIPGTGGQQCRQVQECGVNAQGQQICKTRTVCDGDSGGPQQRCEDKRVCRNVPYQDQNCGYVQVPYTREVTKYRNETRYRQETKTRTVTKYRTETRTRTVTKTRTETRTREVTKYRAEQKCCVTKTRQVFDKQISFDVVLRFPTQAILQANETEDFVVKLISADSNGAQIAVELGQTIYGYKVANQTTQGASIIVDLELAALYDLSNAGEKTIQNLRIDFDNNLQKFRISFIDLFKSSKASSSYEIEIQDLVSGQLIENLSVIDLAGNTKGAVLNTVLDPQAKLKALLKVKRSGLVINNQEIAFTVVATFEKRQLQQSDLASLSDSKKIAGQVVGAGQESALVINDQTIEFADISTEYSVYLDLRNDDGTSKPLNKKVMTREELKKLANTVKLVDIIGSKSIKVLTKGQKLSFDLVALRKGTDGILKGKSVRASASGKFSIQ